MTEEQGADGQQRPALASVATTSGGSSLRRAASRDAIAHAFLAEYHRLLSDALPDVFAVSDVDVRTPTRHRAFVWRVTAARIPLVPERCWPSWLLDHLNTAAATPMLGAEYARQRALLVDLLGIAGPYGCGVA